MNVPHNIVDLATKDSNYLKHLTIAFAAIETTKGHDPSKWKACRNRFFMH